MDIDDSLVTSSVAGLGVITLAGNGGSSFVSIVVDFAAGGYDIAMDDLAGSGNPGFSGFFVGMRFEGAGATSDLNGWRITNAPAIGLAFKSFAAYDSTVPIAGNWSFTAPTPSHLLLGQRGHPSAGPGRDRDVRSGWPRWLAVPPSTST